jgi:putative chitinase
MITADKLREFAPNVKDAETQAAALEAARQASTVNTPGRVAHFLGQVFVESAGFTAMEERFNYRPERLLAVFGKHVKDIADATALIAQGPQAVANRVYANRLGNGDEASGDGWRYRGSGYLQLTGRSHFQTFGDKAGVDLVNNPDHVRELASGAQVAFAYWDATGCSALADAGNITGITKNINGPAMLGLSDRTAATTHAMEIWSE